MIFWFVVVASPAFFAGRGNPFLLFRSLKWIAASAKVRPPRKDGSAPAATRRPFPQGEVKNLFFQSGSTWGVTFIFILRKLKMQIKLRYGIPQY